MIWNRKRPNRGMPKSDSQYCTRTVFCMLASLSMASGQIGGVGGFGSPSGPRSSADGSGTSRGISIRPWVMASGVYAENLTPPATNPGGGLISADAFGGSLMGGVSGSHLSGRTSLSLGYVGAAQYYSGHRGLANSSHVGVFGVAHQLSQKWSLQLSQFGGTSLGGFGMGAGFGGFGSAGALGFSSAFLTNPGGVSSFGNPLLNGVVDNELFDNRVYFYGSNGSITYQPSMRVSYSAGGGAFFTRRRSSALNGVNGLTGNGSVSYQTSRKSSITAFYNYGRFEFPGVFGGNEAHSAGLGFRRELARNTNFTLFAGAFQFRSDFIGQVPLDPITAAILGTGSSLEARRVRRISGAGGANLGHQFKRGLVSVGYSRGVVPGNDVLFSAVRDSVNAVVSYSSSSRWSINGTGFYSRSSGLIQAGRRFDLYQGSGMFSLRLFKSLNMTLGGGYRSLQLGTFSRQQRFATVGLAWMPGEVPLRF